MRGNFAFSPAVGYMEKGTPSTGNAMIAPMFDGVSNKGKIKLSDLKGTGYDKDEGAYGDLGLVVLNKGGSADSFADGKYAGEKKRFYWFDNEDNEPGWYDTNGEVAWDAESIEFNAGDAFWTSGGGQTVTTAGQVGTSDVTVETPATGNKATGNPFAMSLKLGAIYGTGYDPDEGAYGDLSLVVLNKGGSADTFADGKYAGEKMRFYWFDNEDATAGWYDTNGEVAWDGDAVEFSAGQGFWAAGGGQSIVFPAPAALK